MYQKKTEKLETAANPLALIVGESGLSHALSQELHQGGCEVIELNDYPKSGKFDYVFHIGMVDKVRDSYLKFLKPSGKFLFIDCQNEDISEIAKLDRLKIVRVDNLNPWYFSQISDKILKIAFTHSDKNIIDIRLTGNLVRPSPKDISDKSPSYRKKIASLSSKYVHRKISPYLLWSAVILIFIFLFFTSIFYYQAVLVRQIVENARNHFASSDISALNTDIDQLAGKLAAVKSLYGNLNNPLNPFRNYIPFKNIGRFIESSSRFVVSADNTLNLLVSLQTSSQNLTLKDLNLSPARFQQLIDSLNLLSTDAKQLRSVSEDLKISFLSSDAISLFLDNLIVQLDSLTGFLPPFKNIFFNGEKKYLLLFQNNMELRPTGGFIGSVGFLHLTEGRLQNLELLDVYSIDGQQKGHVEPPEPIRKYFNQPNWFLRDSNFDPDFAVSAQQSQWFLDKIMGRKFDGVIGLNFFLVQDLLSVLGPLTLPDFNNEVVTADNLFIKAQLYINTEFFAGSSQKKDFLNSLSDAIFKKLAGEKVAYLKILSLLPKSLMEKNLLFYFNDINLQKEIEGYGWAGRVYDIRCLNVSENCLADYLFINESNFGVNKANFFITKSVLLAKKINTNGQLVTDLTIKYNNQSQKAILQGGQYTNYLRLFLPKNSVLLNAEANGQMITSGMFDISSYQNDKTIYGILLRIPENSDYIFKFSYLLPDNFTSNREAYQFYFQKQAGDKASSLNLSFASSKFQFTPFNFHAQKGQANDLIFQTDSSVDRFFEFKLTP